MLKVLIIDDEPEILNIIGRIIGAEYESRIETAPDGLQGLIKAQESNFDVICTDYNMPTMNGIDFLKALKVSGARNQNTLLLFITGYSPELDVNSKLWENVYFIEKPFSDKNILNYIKMKKCA